MHFFSKLQEDPEYIYQSHLQHDICHGLSPLPASVDRQRDHRKRIVSFISQYESLTVPLQYWGKTLAGNSAVFISYDVEPFLPTLFTHNSTPSAYPPNRTQGLFPINIYYAWLFADADQVVYNAIRTSAQTLEAQAIDEGVSDADAVVYANYAIFDTPLIDLYDTNLPRLQTIKEAVDPGNVMGLAGGFKL